MKVVTDGVLGLLRPGSAAEIHYPARAGPAVGEGDAPEVRREAGLGRDSR